MSEQIKAYYSDLIRETRWEVRKLRSLTAGASRVLEDALEQCGLSPLSDTLDFVAHMLDMMAELGGELEKKLNNARAPAEPTE
ncbi:hypothetical protein [Methylocaldum szegediense]|jgi:hypothetical protein|uniref:hypothetical protein n=1 Tax=Methylocaldum szegediense TaxID=73780 RepID=UPI0004197EA1|nr:hypothetical protein [Methylocaldum szegediense]